MITCYNRRRHESVREIKLRLMGRFIYKIPYLNNKVNILSYINGPGNNFFSLYIQSNFKKSRACSQ